MLSVDSWISVENDKFYGFIYKSACQNRLHIAYTKRRERRAKRLEWEI